MIRFQYQASPESAYEDLNVTDEAIYDLKTSFGYSHPATATWVIRAPQHTTPLASRTFIRIWDDAAPGQSASAPHFEGFIEEINPGQDANEVQYVAYDPTKLASINIPVMSQRWDNETTPDLSAVPRIAFNCTIDNDDDFAYQRASNLTDGNIIATILSDAEFPLRYYHCAPDGSAAYIDEEVDALLYKPQEKVVFESESIRSAIERVLHYEPQMRMIWVPGDRKWRFVDITAAPEVTLTLNKSNGEAIVNDGIVVMSLQLKRALDGRYSAVKIYGPPRPVQTVASLSEGSLTQLYSGLLLQNEFASGGAVDSLLQWQITDPDKWKITRQLITPIEGQIENYNTEYTKSPCLMGYWPANNHGENAGWRVVRGWNPDPTTGIISMLGSAMTRYNPDPEPDQPNWENPTDVALWYCYLGEPFSVRYPEVDFEGTSYDNTNQWTAATHHVYEEMFAVGYEYGVQVTTTARTEQYRTLCALIHKMRCNTIWTGGCMLEGMQWSFSKLNQRVNFASVDGDGNENTTAFKAIGAMVTDVEYDWDMMTTTLQFSSDLMELAEMDQEQVKAALGVRQLEFRAWNNVRLGPAAVRNRLSSDRFGFSTQSNVFEQSYISEGGKGWFDENGRQG